MNTIIEKEEKQTYVIPDLLVENLIKECFETKTSTRKITWTNQYGNEKNIMQLTDSHAANLANWLRDRDLLLAEKIIQGELERRCMNAYPADFDITVQEYVSCPDTWRLKVYN